MATQNTKTKTTLADKDKKVLMILGACLLYTSDAADE